MKKESLTISIAVLEILVALCSLFSIASAATSLSCTGDPSHSCSSYDSVSSIDTVSTVSQANPGDTITVTVDWTGWHWGDPNHFAFFMKPTSGGSWEFIDSCSTFRSDSNIGNHYTMDCPITIPTGYSGDYYIRVTANDYGGYCNPGESGVDAEGSTTITITGNSENAEVTPSNMPWSGYYWPFLEGAHGHINLYSSNGPMENYDSYVLSNGVYAYTYAPFVFESDHPYSNNYDGTWPVTWSGATKIRLHFTRYDIEGHYDHLRILDGSGNEKWDYSNGYGRQINDSVWTPWVDGDKIKVRLTTDGSVTYWGFKVDKVEGVFSGSSGAKNWEYQLFEHSTYRRSGMSGHRTTPPDPAWEGHCNAWSAASIKEDEPTTTRTLNGVEFDLNDQKGLLTSTYMDTISYFWDIDQSKAKLFHDKLREYIKTNGKPIVMDVYTGGAEVWNHPAYKYEMTWYTDPSDPSKTIYTTKVWFKTDGWSDDGTGTPDMDKTYKYYIKTDGTSRFTDDSPDEYPDFMWYPIGRQEPVLDANPCVNYNTVQTIVGG